MQKLLLLSLLFAGSAFANQLQFSVGETAIRGPAKFGELTMIEPLKRSWDLQESILYVESSVNGTHPQPGRLTATVRVTKTFGRFFVGLGGSFSRSDLYNGSRLNFNDSVGFKLTNHIFLIYEHISNAGLKKPNEGRDMPQIAFRFPL